MDVIIYHNPACGTSRNVLAMIRNSGVEPHIIEYLKCPPTRLLLTQLLDRAGLSVRQILREKGHALSRPRSWRSVALRRCAARRHRRASDPDEPAPRRDAERRAPLSSLRGGSRLAAAATRTIHQGGWRAGDRRRTAGASQPRRNSQCPVRTRSHRVGSPCASSPASPSAIWRRAHFMQSAPWKSPRSISRWRP